MTIHPIGRRELFLAEVVLFIAILLQFLVWVVTQELTFGPQHLIIATEIALAVSIAFTSTKRHENRRYLHRTASLVLLALISLANISSFVLVAKSLILNVSHTSGYELLVSAIAIFLTNIIVFSLWYWEIDSPGLTGGKWSKNDKDFHFVQQELKDDFRNWQPNFSDYLYLSLTNAINFGSADGKPLTMQAKALMGTQSLISVFTFWLIVSRSVSILGQ